MATRKTIALTRQTFVGKVMSLLFNTKALYGPPVLHQMYVGGCRHIA